MGSDAEPAKGLLPYLQRADELQKHEPLVAYYCECSLLHPPPGFDPSRSRLAWVLIRFGFVAALDRSALRYGEGAEDPAEGAHQDHQLHPYLPHEPAREGLCLDLGTFASVQLE